MEAHDKEIYDEFKDSSISRRLSNDISYEGTKESFNIFFVKKIHLKELIPYIHTTYQQKKKKKKKKKKN